jgi:hypothetical protein
MEEFTQPGGIGDCRCGSLTGCTQPAFATVTQVGNGQYTVVFFIYTLGVRDLYVSGTYGGTSFVTGGVDLFDQFPVKVDVVGLNVGVTSYPFFVDSPWYVGKEPATFYLVAKDDYGNILTSGGQSSVITIETEPYTGKPKVGQVLSIYVEALMIGISEQLLD